LVVEVEVAVILDILRVLLLLPEVVWEEVVAEVHLILPTIRWDITIFQQQ
jgi:hypothetical protein